MNPEETENLNKIQTIKKLFNSINSWLEKHTVFSNCVVIIGIAIIGMLFTLLPFHPAQLSLETARESNRIANKGVRESEESNRIAKKSQSIAENANAIAKSASRTAEEALSLAKDEFTAQYTSRIRTYITSQNIYVGEGKEFGRDDDVIVVPIVIINKGYGLAKDIKLTIYYDYGSGTERPFEFEIPFLKGNSVFELTPPFGPSILADSRAIYLSRVKTFRMKIFLDWQDALGNGYNSVELFKLYTTEAYVDQPTKFVFVSEGVYSNVENPEEFSRYSKRKIDF